MLLLHKMQIECLESVSFLRYNGAFVSDKLPMIGTDSGVEAIFEPNLSLIKWFLRNLDTGGELQNGA